ncbi:MAG: Flp pilus assembly protein CpaB [Rhizobiales bacterium]|nr:Flp pilus assembly protein CpaB [Hyphomicrobiales bacterium]
MKRARLIVFGIALLAAGGAALLAKGYMGKKPEVRTVVKTDFDTVQVLVAKRDIQLGDTLKAGDIGWIDWPRDAATATYIQKHQKPGAITDLSGAIARAQFLAGEPIKEQKLIKASDGGVMAAILPAGMRAVSTSITAQNAAGNFILPNDRVDVILTRKIRSAGGRREQHVSDTLFRNIRVLAIGSAIDAKGDEKTAKGDTATLELTPTQAETLALANLMGDISLSLRSLTDSRPGQGEGDDGSAVLNKDDRGSSVRVLRYGVSSRAYGVK